jgi:hypothetical protein
MAHFAKLDENNVVIDINVVNNDVLDPQNEETSGIDFLIEWSGGYRNWRQTSYNGTFRKSFAEIGGIYDSVFDVFISPKPYPSWKFNYELHAWKAPVAKPDAVEGFVFKWSEINKEWIQVAIPA